MLVRRTGYGVAAQHHSTTVSPQKVSDGTTREVAADSMERYPWQNFGLLLPDVTTGSSRWTHSWSAACT